MLDALAHQFKTSGDDPHRSRGLRDSFLPPQQQELAELIELRLRGSMDSLHAVSHQPLIRTKLMSGANYSPYSQLTWSISTAGKASTANSE